MLRWVLNPRGGVVPLRLRWALPLWSVAFVGALLVAAMSSAALGPVAAAGLGLALGGATSNLGDRIGRGGVADFIAVPYWPTFNLADVALVGGVVLIVGGGLT